MMRKDPEIALFFFFFYGLYMPWKVTGDMTSTSARAISDRSLALRIRQYVGLWAPGHTTMVSRTPTNQPFKQFHNARNFWFGKSFYAMTL